MLVESPTGDNHGCEERFPGAAKGGVQWDILHVWVVEIFWPRDSHGDRYGVDVGGLLPFFDVIVF